MSMFKDMLGSDESLFRDPVALDYDYIPKMIPFREKEQKHIAMCIKPLFHERNGKNVLVFGRPGVGKTVALRHVLRELEDETDEIIPIYINCWQKNTTFKIIMEICENIGYKFTHNKKGDELFKILKEKLNKKSVVFVLDEVDKLEDLDFIYYILEDIYRKTVILITNYREWIVELDERIKSRLVADMVEFKKYNENETIGIMRNRLSYAFVEGVWDNDAFLLAAQKAYELGDVRSGLYLLKEAGNAAEEESSKQIIGRHVQKAIVKMDEFFIKKKSELKDESQEILILIKENDNCKIGDLFRIYQKNGGTMTYKSFQRNIKKLSDNKFITTKKETGIGGNTTIITYQGEVKKLTEY